MACRAIPMDFGLLSYLLLGSSKGSAGLLHLLMLKHEWPSRGVQALGRQARDQAPKPTIMIALRLLGKCMIIECFGKYEKWNPFSSGVSIVMFVLHAKVSSTTTRRMTGIC